MENNQMLLIILLGIFAIIGLVATVAYYFARYSFKGDELPHIEVPQPVPPEVVPPPSAPTVESALVKTKEGLWGRMSRLFKSESLSDELREHMEEILYTSDLGVATVEKLMNALREKWGQGGASQPEKVKEILRGEILSIFGGVSMRTLLAPSQFVVQPAVWLVVGVNGVGKTTSIGKLAFALAQNNKKVLVAAGDTFRAAAGEQLRIWTERAQVEIFAPESVTDPAAVAHMAYERAKGNGFDVVIIDTAGRLHTQKNLMEELKKVKRVLSKLEASSPQETLLVLDANSGQNAIVQAREFHQALNLTGVILTKMDGTAKGGVAVALAAELKLPPLLLGIGEGVRDLRPFEAREYVDAIL